MIRNRCGPGIGRLSDSFGRKWPSVGLALFGAIGCAVTASAHSPQTAIVGCTLGGLGYLGTMLSYSIPSVRRPGLISDNKQRVADLGFFL
jgi:MFS family permease